MGRSPRQVLCQTPLCFWKIDLLKMIKKMCFREDVASNNDTEFCLHGFI